MESRQEAVGAAEEFLDLQLADANDQLNKAVRNWHVRGCRKISSVKAAGHWKR